MTRSVFHILEWIDLEEYTQEDIDYMRHYLTEGQNSGRLCKQVVDYYLDLIEQKEQLLR